MKKGAIIVGVVAIIAAIAGYIYFKDLQAALTMTCVSVAGVGLGMLDSDSNTKIIHWVQVVIHAALMIVLLQFVYKYTAIIVPIRECIVIYVVTTLLTNIIISITKSE